MSQTQDGPEREPVAGTPVWVKAVAIAAVLVVVLFIILHLNGLSPWGHGG
jgi:hypothetical protein